MVILSTSVERFIVSRMQDFFFSFCFHIWFCLGRCTKLTDFLHFFSHIFTFPLRMVLPIVCVSDFLKSKIIEYIIDSTFSIAKCSLYYFGAISIYTVIYIFIYFNFFLKLQKLNTDLPSTFYNSLSIWRVGQENQEKYKNVGTA